MKNTSRSGRHFRPDFTDGVHHDPYTHRHPFPKHFRQHMEKHHRQGKIFMAIVLVIAGAVILGHNLGFIGKALFDILISWQMVLVVLGVGSMARGHIFGGITLIGIGTFFLIPAFTASGAGWIQTYWPVFIILLGIGILAKAFRKKKRRCFPDETEVRYDSDNGFVNCEVYMGSNIQVVLDPVFQGAKLQNRYGAIRLDLRRTALKEGITYIDVDCTLGGIELLIPDHWNVITELQTFMGGCHDKRLPSVYDTDEGRTLILRGSLSLSGIEIKS